MIQKKLIVWFDEIDKDDVALVGGKGANLGEMTQNSFPIPYGFILTSNAYFEFLKFNQLMPKIKAFLSKLNVENPVELHQVSTHIKQIIENGQIPESLIKKITYFYEHLRLKEEKKPLNFWHITTHKIKHLYKPPLVAVRSSATAEDLPDASFAGQQETYLNIAGETHLLKTIKRCWASLFTERAIFYRQTKKFDHFKVGLAVVVQRMIQSDKSGIAFSIDPVNNDKNKIIIEAIFGLGEYVVSGKVTPDHYEVDKKTLVITKKEIKRQTIKLVKAGVYNKEITLSKAEAYLQKLSDEEIIKVALLVRDIERHYYFPQDIEWAIEKGKVFIVQSRPVTTISQKKEDSSNLEVKGNIFPILIGSPASPGIAFGPVKILTSPKEIEKIKVGDILLATQTNPDYVPAMKKAAAIVTDKGGRTSHAAIVSRELGIPAVVGTEKATKILKNDQIITVNGQSGEIFLGKVVTVDNKKHPLKTQQKKINTITKIYVNLAQPQEVEKVSQMDVDGVGLLRAEFMIADIGVHPKKMIKEGKEKKFINQLSTNLLTFAHSFKPRPVIYRATDFKTNEYRNLIGGKEFEPVEENPMLGFRGVSRYLVNKDVFLLELKAIAEVWERGYRNLHLMIPFVRLPWELIAIKEIITDFGLLNYPEFKLYIMVEVPSCALMIEEFLKIGVDGVSIGSNDLTMMLLGVDRDNDAVSHLYDERNKVVVDTMINVVKAAKKYGVSSSICGQAPSDYPQIVESLIEAGISSLSVNIDAIERTKELVYEIEKKLYKR
jgi:pyruvate,water dikinase